ARQKVAQLQAQAQADGLRRGQAEGKAKLADALNQFQQVMLAAQNDRGRMLAGSEAEIVRLVLQVVRKILKIEPIINEQALVRVVRDALERLGQRVDVNIYVHPEDVELLHFSLSQISDLALEIVIEPDDNVEPGGCRIESRAGEIDARLSTQFEAVARSFLAVAEGKENQIE
ncbi:MAG TPA: FliH/SctL family protein, partial [Candidatus Obscuribacterales bacterium]